MKVSFRHSSGPSRRRLLLALAGLPAALQSRAFGQTVSHAGVNAAVPPTRLIVSGGETSTAGEFAQLISPELTHDLGLSAPMEVKFDLGHDGVTAANLFDHSTSDDNSELALVSKGAAIIASLCDDRRVHFDYSRWMNVFIAQQTVVTIAKADLHRTFRDRISGFIHDQPLRVAVSQPTGVELASVLGFSILGFHPIPISGIVSGRKAIDAFASGSVDAIQLTMSSEADRALLKQLPSGAKPLFHFGPALNGTLSFEAAYRMANGRATASSLYNAWRALSAAAATPLILALPMLTPAVSVARWRFATKSLVENADIQTWLQAHAMTQKTGIGASNSVAGFTPELSSLLALRRWLNINLPRWRIGQETKRPF